MHNFVITMAVALLLIPVSQLITKGLDIFLEDVETLIKINFLIVSAFVFASFGVFMWVFL